MVSRSRLPLPACHKYARSVRLSALILVALVIVPVGVFAAGRSSAGPCYHSTLPTLAQQLAIWKAAHGGALCTTVGNTTTCNASDGNTFSTTKIITHRYAPECLPKNTPPSSVVNRILNDLRQ